MNAPYRQIIDCPQCGFRHTAESEFGRWVRNHPELPSREGLAITDSDYWVHRFKTYGRRDFQCIMLVEIKTHGRAMDVSQQDTIYQVHQLLRNRRDTPTKTTRHQAGTSIVKVRSAISGRYVRVRCFGAFVLTFSGTGPINSKEIRWNKQQIDTSTLVKILRFDLDPETLRPMDFRSHHRQPEPHPELIIS